MKITTAIQINMAKRGVPFVLDAVQSDANTRAVAVTLTENGAAWMPPEDAHISVAFHNRTSGKKGWYDTLPNGESACTAEGNVVTAALAPAVLAQAGEVEVCIVFQDENLNQLTSFSFYILVSENISAGGTIEGSYYRYSTMEKVNEAIEKIQDEVAYVNQAATPIMGQEKGTALCLPDISDRPLHALSVYGKSVLSGTPSPDAPATIKNVGDGESVKLYMTGKNMARFDEVKDGYWNINNGSLETDMANRKSIILKNLLPNTKYTISSSSTISWFWYYNGSTSIEIVRPISKKIYTFTTPANCDTLRVTLNVTNDPLEWVQLEFGDTATAYEPAKEVQSLVLPLSDALRGIPVASDGNYTDESGQQWLCDEVNYQRGTLLKRVLKIVLDGSDDELWKAGGATDPFTCTFYTKKYIDMVVGAAEDEIAAGICTHYPIVCSDNSDLESGTAYNDVGISIVDSGTIYLYDESVASDSSMALLKEKLASSPITLVLPLVEPVETPLDEEALADYAKLCPNKPVTSVYTDVGAELFASYVVDTKAYIDNKFNALATALVANS